MNKSFLLLIATALAVSCISEQQEQSPDGGILQIRVQEAETKTVLSDLNIRFGENEKMKVYCEGINSLLVSNAETGDRSVFEGSFHVMGRSGDDCDWYCVYPSGLTVSETGIISGSIPETQIAPFDPAANMMYSDIVVADYDEINPPDLSFQMNQMIGLIRISFQNTNASYEDDILESVQLRSSVDLTGAYDFDIHSPSVALSGYTSTHVTSMYQSEVTLGLNEERWVCLFVNPVLISNARLIIRTNNHTFTYTSSGSFTPLAGSVTVLQKALNQPLDLSDFSVRGHSYLKRRIACWGDSFTSANYEEKATYCKHLQNLLGEEWEVLNGGISGNRTDEIAARQGGLPLVTGSAFIIPAGSGTIRIDGLLKTHGIMGEPNLYHIRTFGGALANPCKVVGTHGEEVLCTINSYRSVSGTDTTYYANLTYSKVSTPIEIAEHTPVQTYAARELKDVDLSIIYMGTNGSFGSNSDNNRYVYSRWDNLAEQHQEMIDFVDNSDDYIVLGRHDALSWDNMGYSTYMESVFGNRYLNLRTPVVGNKAVVKSWLMYSGLYADESEIPQEEVDRSVLGYWPRPLQHAPNDVHPNDYGAKVIAKIVYDRMVDLHYLDY